MNLMTEILEQNLNKNERIKGVCTIDKIKNILRKNKIEKNIIDKIDGNFISNKDKESVSLFEIKVKQERNKNSNKEKQLGKKMGNYILKNYRLNKQKDFDFKKLDYKKNVDSLKKDEEMKLFNMPLKDVVSLEISSKYSLTDDKKINKQKMKIILEEEKDNQMLNYLLNMKFGDWIDVFTFQMEINSKFKFNGIENILNSLYKNEKDEYFSRFIFYLFNYKNWFLNKKGRKPKNINK